MCQSPCAHRKLTDRPSLWRAHSSMSLTYSSPPFCPLHLSHRLFSNVLYQHDKPYHRHDEGTMGRQIAKHLANTSVWRFWIQEPISLRSKVQEVLQFSQMAGSFKDLGHGKNFPGCLPTEPHMCQKMASSIATCSKCPPLSRPLRVLDSTPHRKWQCGTVGTGDKMWKQVHSCWRQHTKQTAVALCQALSWSWPASRARPGHLG